MGQQRLFLSPPHMSGAELELVRQAFETNYIAPLGPMVEAFEAEFAANTGIEHCLALSSGTAAIHLGLRCLGVGPGDSVMVSTLTFIGSVAPVVYLGAEPVFIDCDETTWTMDPALLEQALTVAARQGRIPKAVVPTDLYGQCCDVDAIRTVCDRFGVPILLDSAEAVGARYKSQSAGVGAAVAAFSFNGNKIITTSGGGLLASPDKGKINYARFLSQQARDPAPHYQHSEVGYNYRLSNILAAIGLAQLRMLDKRVRRRREIFDFYRGHLKNCSGISFMPEAPYGQSTRWLTVITIDPQAFGAGREHVRLALESENIEARPVWKPMHLQPVFQDARCLGGRVSEHLFDRGLCLPSGTQMTESDLQRVVEVVTGAARR